MTLVETEINWPKSYSYNDVARALAFVKETQFANEAERFAAFEVLINRKSGNAGELGVPDCFKEIPYFTNLIVKINKARETMLTELFNSINKLMADFKTFTAAIALSRPELKAMLDDAFGTVYGKMSTDSNNAEKSLLAIYNSDSKNVELYAKRFNKLKYGLSCIIWGGEINLDVFKEEGKELDDLSKKFTFLREVAQSISAQEKQQLIVFLKSFIINTVGIFMVRRCNVVFGNNPTLIRLVSYFEKCTIAGLKELYTHEKNPLGEFNEVADKEICKKIRNTPEYNEKMARAFNQFIIRVE